MVRRALVIVVLTLTTGLVGVTPALALGPIDLFADAGLRIDGALSANGAGRSVSGAGDVNGDGIDDVIVGTPAAGFNSRTGSGSAYVVYGQNGSTGVDLARWGRPVSGLTVPPGRTRPVTRWRAPET